MKGTNVWPLQKEPKCHDISMNMHFYEGSYIKFDLESEKSQISDNEKSPKFFKGSKNFNKIEKKIQHSTKKWDFSTVPWKYQNQEN